MKCRITIYFLSYACRLTLRPVGRFVVAGGGELAGLASIGQHGPDLPGAGTRGFKNNVSPVGRPAGTLVAPHVVSQFDNLAAGDFHDVDVVIIAGSAPTEGEKLAVGCPRWIDQIAFVGQIEVGGIGAVGIHEIEFWNSAAVADKRDALAGFRIPHRRSP